MAQYTKSTQTILRGVPVSLPANPRGSCSRDSGAGMGKSIVAMGGPGFTAIAAGASATLTFTVREDGHLDRLFISSTGDLAEVVVTSIEHNNDLLISGSCPGQMFSTDSVAPVLFGQYVRVSDNLQITITNAGAAAANLQAGFSIA